jgi:hypothetical protein
VTRVGATPWRRGTRCDRAVRGAEYSQPDGRLVLVTNQFASGIDWERGGYAVSREGETLVLIQGTRVKARVGDYVRGGGGEGRAGLIPCGRLEVTPG